MLVSCLLSLGFLAPLFAQRAPGSLFAQRAPGSGVIMSQHTSDPDNPMYEALAARFPRTVAAFAAMGALDHLDRVAQLDAIWDEIRQPTTDHRSPTTAHRRPTTDDIYAYSKLKRPEGTRNSKLNIDFDLIYAGGGLGLLHAVVM